MTYNPFPFLDFSLLRELERGSGHVEAFLEFPSDVSDGPGPDAELIFADELLIEERGKPP